MSESMEMAIYEAIERASRRTRFKLFFHTYYSELEEIINHWLDKNQHINILDFKTLTSLNYIGVCIMYTERIPLEATNEN